MQTVRLASATPVPAAPLQLVERFLRDRESVWQQIASEYRLNTLLKDMLLNSSIALACYGTVLGLSQGGLQGLASAIKLPLLFLLTPGICLPTLYLSNLLFGGRLSARQVLALILASTTVTALLCMACAPISLFFLITTHDYEFVVLLNVGILAVTSLAGVRYLIGGVQFINGAASDEVAPPLLVDDSGEIDVPRPGKGAPRRLANLRLLQLWLVLYAFVGSQLGWTLRPFFGAPDLPFQLFRSVEGDFFTSVIHMLIKIIL
jgi:hypothetical protein